MDRPQGIAWVGLYAHDREALARFYSEQVGLALIGRDAGAVMLDAGGGALLEIWGDGAACPPRKSPRQQSVLVGFRVESLERSMATLARRGVQPDGPIGSEGGARWVHYTDPEGNRFELKDFNG